MEDIKHMVEQLEDAQRLGSPPILVVSDAIDAGTFKKLKALVEKKVPGTEIITISEARINKVRDRLREAMGIDQTNATSKKAKTK